MSRTIVQVYNRNRYKGSATLVTYFPRERVKLGKLFGQAARVTFHTRVYDRATGGVVTFVAAQGSFGTEQPSEACRMFTLTNITMAPASSPPYDVTTMPNLPDDGAFYITPEMGNVDVMVQVSGGANVWVEFETWATVEIED